MKEERAEHWGWTKQLSLILQEKSVLIRMEVQTTTTVKKQQMRQM